jgi:hypothetical protein
VKKMDIRNKLDAVQIDWGVGDGWNSHSMGGSSS